ncbi:bacteriohemerythrin [Gammaproteobacteria bacterium]|nr:bacteriohemerythrin [Gammaproteobacteria bacterium]
MKNVIWTLVMALFVVSMAIAALLAFVSFGIGHPAPWILTAAVAAVPLVHNWSQNRGFVRWKDSYSVGIKTIDEEHKNLLRLINNLQSAVRYYTGEEFERRALAELIEYTKVHFAREEDLMKKYGFPGYEEHKRQHVEMTARAQKMVSRYEQDALGAMDEISTFLRDWLINHINGTDQQYSEFLISKGVQ